MMELNQNEELFINITYPYIMDISKKFNILPSVLEANSIIESSWGSSNVYRLYYNMYNIPSDNNWYGKVYSVDSGKVYNTKADCKETAPVLLKVFNNYHEGLEEYAIYLTSSRRSKNGPLRYGSIIGDCDYKSVVDKLIRHGYLQDHLHKQDDPSYSSNVISIIEKYELYKWDNDFKKHMEEENVVAKALKRNIKFNNQKDDAVNVQSKQEDIKTEEEIHESNDIQEEADIDLKEETKEEIYRVRLSWEDADSQLLATPNIYEAKAEASNHTGYKVYSGDDGDLVEDPWEDMTENSIKVYTFTPGKALILDKCPLYRDYSDITPFMSITGKFYTYNSHIVNSKIRISKCGDPNKLNGKDIAIILGCIDVRDI